MDMNLIMFVFASACPLVLAVACAVLGITHFDGDA